MSDSPSYSPPAVWTWKPGNGGAFANINRPTAGARFEAELPVGKHPLQLYSLATPNGMKVTIMLEELLDGGHKGAEYEDWMRWFRSLDEYVCIPLAPRRPEIARRPEPEAEPDRPQKSKRVYRKPSKTIRKPRPPKRTVTRPKKPKKTVRRTARKPKSSSSAGASYNSLLRGGR